MFVHVHSVAGPFFRVLDRDSGEEIKLVRWADDTLGRLERFEDDGRGNPKIAADRKSCVTITESRRIRLVDTRFSSDP